MQQLRCFNYRIHGQKEVCKVYAYTRKEADGRMHAASRNKRKIRDAEINKVSAKLIKLAKIEFLGISDVEPPELSLEL